MLLKTKESSRSSHFTIKSSRSRWADQIAKTYAEKLFFNDTIVTLRNRKDLLKYLQHTQQQLDSMSFEVLGVQEKGDDVFVRWTMHTRFTVMGQSRSIHSIGQ